MIFVPQFHRVILTIGSKTQDERRASQNKEVNQEGRNEREGSLQQDENYFITCHAALGRSPC